MKLQIPAVINQLPLSIKLVIAGIALVSVVGLLGAGAGAISRAYYNRQIESLHEANQEAEKTILKLEGQVQSLSTTLAVTNAQLEIARAELSVTIEAANNAKTNYIEVRNGKRPTFVSTDTAGKVAELTKLLDEEYPDSPSPR